MAAVRGQARVAVPVPGQFHRAIRLIRRRHEDQREAALVVLVAAGLFQAEQPVEGHRRFKVQHPDHRVQVFHAHAALPSPVCANTSSAPPAPEAPPDTLATHFRGHTAHRGCPHVVP